MKVKPAKGMLVRDPYTRVPLPPEGRNVPENSYWLRRVMFGDVVKIGEPEAEVKPATKPKPKSDSK